MISVQNCKINILARIGVLDQTASCFDYDDKSQHLRYNAINVSLFWMSYLW